MMQPAPAPTVVVLVHNVFTHDSRVLREAESLAFAGWRVVVVATARDDLPDHESLAGFDVERITYRPLDVRLWRHRDYAQRPWRYWRRYAHWVRRSFGPSPRSLAKGAFTLAVGALALPWVVLAAGYRVMLRVADLLIRRSPSPSRALGAWIEQRAHGLVFAAHRPLRLMDWGRRIERAVATGVLPVADVWHANDLETLPAALGLSGRFGGQVVYDSHEIFLEAAGRAELGRIRRRVLRLAERRWARRAAAVVTVNSAVADELVRRYRIPPPVVVRNCPPAWAPRGPVRSPLADALEGVVDDPGLPIILAHGLFRRDRGYDELLAAAVSLQDANVVFLGYGGREDAFRALAEVPPWKGRLAVLPAVPPTELLDWIAGASIAACLIQPTTLNHVLSTPNKLFEAIAAGVPLVAADLPAIAEVVRSSGAGVLVDATDVDAIRLALRSLLDDPALRRRLGAAGRAAAAREMNWEHEAAGLIELYRGLHPRRPAAA